MCSLVLFIIVISNRVSAIPVCSASWFFGSPSPDVLFGNCHLDCQKLKWPPGCVTGIAHGKSSALVATCLPQHLHSVLRLTRILSRTLPIAVLRPGFALHINPLNAKLNPICHLLALLWAHHILHVSRIRVNMNNNDWTDKRDMFCVDLRTNSDYFPIQH